MSKILSLPLLCLGLLFFSINQHANANCGTPEYYIIEDYNDLESWILNYQQENGELDAPITRYTKEEPYGEEQILIESYFAPLQSANAPYCVPGGMGESESISTSLSLYDFLMETYGSMLDDVVFAMVVTDSGVTARVVNVGNSNIDDLNGLIR